MSLRRFARTPSLLRLLALAATALVLVPQLGCDPDPPAVREFNLYVQQNRCESGSDVECVEVLTYDACASGCPRTGYNFRWHTPGRAEIHLTLTLMRLLRNAAVAHPTLASQHTLGMSFEDLLWHQIEMYLNHPDARYQATSRSGSLRAVGLADVRTGNVVDPARFFMVTWVNEGGSAHAMTQADMAMWLLTLAASWTVVGQPQRAEPYLRLSDRVFRSYGIPHRDGGVRNDRAGNRCYDDRYCYWFHSFPVGTEPYPMTVLNQHLHAVRDALVAHELLARWREQGLEGVDGTVHPLPTGFTPTLVDQLREWGRGGLLQLAFGPGNAAISDAPPNLAEFLAPEAVVSGVQRYRAHYRYDMGVGPGDISAKNNCHYHYHSLKVMVDILDLIARPPFDGDLYFVEIYHGLLYGRARGEPVSCTHRYIPKTMKVMTGVPLAELYYGSIIAQGWQAWCEEGEPQDFRSGAGGYGPVKSFLDAAYEDCSF